MDFLKTALSPPDFAIGTFDGIPDDYDGRVVTKSWSSIQSLPALTDGLPTYIVQLPVPGVAYFYGQVTAGALSLTPIYYSDVATLYPTGAETTNVTNFRFGGQAMEIIPTVNSMTWTGSVQVYRGSVDLAPSTVMISGAYSSCLTVNGLASLVNSVRPDAVHPFNMGCFCVSRQTESDFPFHPVLPAVLTGELPFTSGGSITVSFGGSTSFYGLGSTEAIIYKIPSYSAVGNAMTLRTWQFVEFQVNSNSLLYEYSHMSPPSDAYALALVKKAFRELNVCVPYYENEGMWAKVLEFIKRTSTLLSFVPGPVGAIATGTSMIAEAISALA